jgi:hypothetical protein
MVSSKEETIDGEREALSRSPFVAAIAPYGARSNEQARGEGKEEKQDCNCATGASLTISRADEFQHQFETLQAVWARPWCDDERADRAAFDKACREADAADIIEAAKTWAAAADAARFLPPLAKWLNSRGWLKVPPARRQRTSGHRNGSKVDTAAMMLAMANQFELEEAGQ